MAKKIFLVDDEPINNAINKKVLEILAPDGEYIDYTNPLMAFNALAERQPDLIFLDLNMPGMSGWDFLDKMMAEGHTNGVVVLTSSVSDVDRNRAESYKNVVDFVNKPVSKELFQQFL